MIGKFSVVDKGLDNAACVNQRAKILTVIVKLFSKKQIECGLALSALLSTTIFVITVVKFCCGLTRHNILTTVMTNIFVDKSADNAKPHSIC